MDEQIESEFYDDAPKKSVGNTVEDLKLINDIVQNVSRNMRKSDWTYLGRHPEVRAIIRVIVTEAVQSKGDESIYHFAADLFRAKNRRKLKRLINKQLKWVNEQRKSGAWSSADGMMVFSATSSSSFDNTNQSNCEKYDYKNAESEADETYLNQDACPDYFRPSC